MALEKFRSLCRELLAEGVKPTPTEFAKRGWPYVQVGNYRLYAQDGHPKPPPGATPGSGTTWVNGRYTAARREELIAAGWTWVAYPGTRFPETNGRWEPPTK